MPTGEHVHHCMGCNDTPHPWTHKAWGCEYGAEMDCPEAKKDEA